MKMKDLKDIIKGMYESDPEVDRVEALQTALEEAQDYLGKKDVPSLKTIRKACDELVEEGILQPAGREGYEASEEFMEENS